MSIIAKSDERSLVALEHVSKMLEASDAHGMKETQTTTDSIQLIFIHMQQQMATLAKETQKLKEGLIVVESRQHQVAMAHEAEVGALKSKIRSAEECVKEMRNETAEITQKTEASVAAITADKQMAVKLIAQASDMRVAAIRKEYFAELEAFDTSNNALDTSCKDKVWAHHQSMLNANDKLHSLINRMYESRDRYWKYKDSSAYYESQDAGKMLSKIEHSGGFKTIAEVNLR